MKADMTDVEALERYMLPKARLRFADRDQQMALTRKQRHKVRSNLVRASVIVCNYSTTGLMAKSLLNLFFGSYFPLIFCNRS